MQILNEIGFFYIKENQNPDAIEILERARETESENHRTRHYLGLAYMRDGRLAEAEEELRTAVSLRPRDIQLRYSLSRILEKGERYAEAVKTLEETADLAETPAEHEKIKQHIAALTTKANRAEIERPGPAAAPEET